MIDLSSSFALQFQKSTKHKIDCMIIKKILTAGSPKCVALEWSGLKASCKAIMLHEKSTMYTIGTHIIFPSRGQLNTPCKVQSKYTSTHRHNF